MFMDFEDSYNNRELEAVRKMINSSAFLVRENNIRGDRYREEAQYGAGHDGRGESRGEKQRNGADAQTANFLRHLHAAEIDERGSESFYNNQ